MLAASNQVKTIKSRADFVYLIKKGRRFSVNSWMVFNFEKKDLGGLRFGWTLPRYIGLAVTRNRIKRWCREIIRDVLKEVEEVPSLDINIVLRKQNRKFYKNMKYDSFKKVLQPHLQKLINSD